MIKHWGTVRSNLLRLGVPARDVEDATQEVFLVALRRAPDFPTEAALRSWLWETSRRVAAHARRSDGRRLETPMGDAPPLDAPPEVEGRTAEGSPEELLQSSQARAAVSAAMRELDDDKQDALSIYAAGTLTLQETAELVGIPAQTLYARYQAAVDETQRKVRRRMVAGGQPQGAGHVPEVEHLRASVHLEAGGAVARVGNTVLVVYCRTFKADLVDPIERAVVEAHRRHHEGCVLLGWVVPGFGLPDAAARRALREHIARAAGCVRLSVDVIDLPVWRSVAAIIRGALLLSPRPPRFAVVPSLEAARSLVEPVLRADDGSALSWSQLKAHYAELLESTRG